MTSLERGRKVFATVTVLTFLLLVAGLLADAQLGLPLSRGVRATAAWLAGLLGLRALYGFGEMGAARINAPAHVHHPPWQRALPLFALLGFCDGGVGRMRGPR